MLYRKNTEGLLQTELFINPTSEYRGAPFWAWNCKLEKGKLLPQIDVFKTMGMGGFHMHCRTGMATEYLGAEFMDIVKACDEKAKREGMLCWLYDEDRYSSGTAGGRVTKNFKYRARHMVFTCFEEKTFEKGKAEFDEAVNNNKKPSGYLIARYAIKLKDGFLTDFRRLKDDETALIDHEIWYAYIEIDKETPWFNNQTYVNTLDKSAVEEFIKQTHEKYYEVLGDEFGKSVPAIFTDEPHFSKKGFLRFAEEKARIELPFTDDLDETFTKTYGFSLLDHIPELVWELPNSTVSRARYCYHDHLCERFASAYADTVGGWCQSHGLMLTGHMFEEDSLESQTATIGEAMRSYRSFQLPGIDMLADLRNFSTAKQAESAVHQYGREGMMCELYGVTNWDFDFKGHKLQGDWLASQGVTVRVHHLTWASMEGEAKRDYPASIGKQSTWYTEYSMIENHFARLNTALTRGKPNVRVGVIHPIESTWIYWGPREQTSDKRLDLEENFQNVTRWLLFGLIDFDFICESLFPSLCCDCAKVPMEVGEMKYDVIIVPGNFTLRSTTVKRLEAFKEAGGKVIFLGEPASLVDAVRSNRVKRLAEDCVNIPFRRLSLLDELKDVRDVDVTIEDGVRSNNLFYNMRNDGENRWLFICHVNHGEKAYTQWKGEYVDADFKNSCKIQIRGQWKPVVYDTINGEIYDAAAEITENDTVLNVTMYSQDSLLLLLKPFAIGDTVKNPVKCSEKKEKTVIDLADPIPFTLSEPNVMLLDMAAYALDGGAWNKREEILKIDNIVRKQLQHTAENRNGGAAVGRG